MCSYLVWDSGSNGPLVAREPTESAPAVPRRGRGLTGMLPCGAAPLERKQGHRQCTCPPQHETCSGYTSVLPFSPGNPGAPTGPGAPGCPGVPMIPISPLGPVDKMNAWNQREVPGLMKEQDQACSCHHTRQEDAGRPPTLEAWKSRCALLSRRARHP